MATWSDVVRAGLELPEAAVGEAHEGSPALFVRDKQFARLRWGDDDAEILQFWVPDAGVVNAYVADDPATFASAAGFSRKVVMARLSNVNAQTLREVVVESWACRAPARLRKAHRC